MEAFFFFVTQRIALGSITDDRCSTSNGQVGLQRSLASSHSEGGYVLPWWKDNSDSLLFVCLFVLPETTGKLDPSEPLAILSTGVLFNLTVG